MKKIIVGSVVGLLVLVAGVIVTYKHKSFHVKNGSEIKRDIAYDFSASISLSDQEAQKAMSSLIILLEEISGDISKFIRDNSNQIIFMPEEELQCLEDAFEDYSNQRQVRKFQKKIKNIYKESSQEYGYVSSSYFLPRVIREVRLFIDGAYKHLRSKNCSEGKDFIELEHLKLVQKNLGLIENYLMTHNDISLCLLNTRTSSKILKKFKFSKIFKLQKVFEKFKITEMLNENLQMLFDSVYKKVQISGIFERARAALTTVLLSEDFWNMQGKALIYDLKNNRDFYTIELRKHCDYNLKKQYQ